MTELTLEDLMGTAEDPISVLRNARYGTDAQGPAVLMPSPMIPLVPPEFSSWEYEQRAWREAAVLYDQTHHMTDLYLSGPDALTLVQHLATNSSGNFTIGRGNQMVMCSEDGYYVADGIICRVEDDRFNYNGLETGVNWIMFHAARGDFNVKLEKCEKSPGYPNGKAHSRKSCRFQIQGPNAQALIEKLNGGPIDDVKFFHMTQLTIDGLQVNALRHGMAGALGLEIWAPYECREHIRSSVVEAGRDFGLTLVGHRSYVTASVESAWMGAVVPAVYTGESTRDYRRWLPARSAEGSIMLKGSYWPERMEDYYLTPYSLGYGPFVKFDHEFIGRKALEEMDASKQRKKVTLEWNGTDLLEIFSDMLNPVGVGYKVMDLPWPQYQMQTSRACNAVLKKDEVVGISFNDAYSVTERAFLSLATVDPDIQEGDVVDVMWGEAGGGRPDSFIRKTTPLRIRAIVGPTPYSKMARESYAEGWRTRRHS